jgi:ribosomal protein S18 acetylase RimI-like enzyme
MIRVFPMSDDWTVRPARQHDIPRLAAIADATIFPADLLAPMMAPYLSDPEAGEDWLLAEGAAGPCGFAYTVPERLTQGTFNMLALAVAPDLQRQGVGGQLVRAVMDRVAGQGGRLLLVETSGLADQDGARAFYRRQGFVEEARIRDFYADSEDKVVFCRRLAT